MTTLRHIATVACKHFFFLFYGKMRLGSNCLVWSQRGKKTQPKPRKEKKQNKNKTKLGDPKQSQRQQTNSIIKAIGRLWTRKLHERLWGLDQWRSGSQIMLHCSEHQTNTRRFINGGSFTKRGAEPASGGGGMKEASIRWQEKQTLPRLRRLRSKSALNRVFPSYPTVRRIIIFYYYDLLDLSFSFKQAMTLLFETASSQITSNQSKGLNLLWFPRRWLHSATCCRHHLILTPPVFLLQEFYTHFCLVCFLLNFILFIYSIFVVGLWWRCSATHRPGM